MSGYRIRWIVCVVLLLTVGGFLVWLLGTTGLRGWTTKVELGRTYMLVLHSVAAAIATFTLACTYLDKTPVTLKYQVLGDDNIPEVQHSFVHSGRWCTFTVWCNTIAACYFWLVTIACFLTIWHGTEALPKFLPLILGVLWDISLPMGFLVNLIVSFVLIPNLKNKGQLDMLSKLLKWRGQILHNGYVIAVSLETSFVSPEIPLSSFPIIALYGMTYVLFSYIFFARSGVFVYFFLDPRWKHSPFGLVGLLVLLVVLFFAGSAATSWCSGTAATAWFSKCLVIVAALLTCTFRAPAAIEQSNLLSPGNAVAES